MQKIIIAGLTAVGLGVAATAGASAAPVGGAVIGDLATGTSPVTTVDWRYGSYGYYGGHWRYGSHGGHWRYGSYGGHWRWGSHGGHWRWGSRGY
jgi:hypothetical protein